MEVCRKHKKRSQLSSWISYARCGRREVFRRTGEIDPAARVIISSGHGQERDANDLLKERALRFVQKPCRLASLIGMIGDVIEKNGEENTEDKQQTGIKD